MDGLSPNNIAKHNWVSEIRNILLLLSFERGGGLPFAQSGHYKVNTPFFCRSDISSLFVPDWAVLISHLSPQPNSKSGTQHSQVFYDTAHLLLTLIFLRQESIQQNKIICIQTLDFGMTFWNQYTNICTFGTQAFLDFWNQHDNWHLGFRTVYNHITIVTWNTAHLGSKMAYIHIVSILRG